jgi:hypothetical protein
LLPENYFEQRTVVFVLGMHRSGTSALAGVLNALGCDLPRTTMPENEANKRGFFESLTFANFHDRLLSSADSQWDEWQTISTKWYESNEFEKFKSEAKQKFIHEFGEDNLVVFKDPRICRLLPFWNSVIKELGIRPTYLLTVRNPEEVASSLNKRDGITPEIGHLIWLRHHLEGEAHSRGALRCFTNYNELLSDWFNVASKANTLLHLQLRLNDPDSTQKVRSFLSSDLRTFTAKDLEGVLSPMVSSAFEIFNRWAKVGEDADDYVALDGILDELERNALSFGSFTGLLRIGQSERDELTRERAELAAERDELIAELEELTAQKNTLLDKHNALICYITTKSALLKRPFRAFVKFQLAKLIRLIPGLTDKHREQLDRIVEINDSVSVATRIAQFKTSE